PAAHHGRLAHPVAALLDPAVGGGGAREAVVDEHDAVADEDLVLDADAGAEEGVALHLDAASEDDVALDLDERADEGLLADRAAVEVTETGEADVLAQDDVLADTGEGGAHESAPVGRG